MKYISSSSYLGRGGRRRSVVVVEVDGPAVEVDDAEAEEAVVRAAEELLETES